MGTLFTSSGERLTLWCLITWYMSTISTQTNGQKLLQILKYRRLILILQCHWMAKCIFMEDIFLKRQPIWLTYTALISSKRNGNRFIKEVKMINLKEDLILIWLLTMDVFGFLEDLMENLHLLTSGNLIWNNLNGKKIEASHGPEVFLW